MQTALKIISLLLSYPEAELAAEMPAVRSAIAQCRSLDETQRRLLDELAADIAALDVMEAQERFVFLFDRTRSLSLHLFEHVHGESRDRGQAMVDLLGMYEADGFEIEAKELPDYLPMFLEFLSTKSDGESDELLGQTLHIIVALGERLKKRKSIYSNAFVVLQGLAAGAPDAKLLDGLLAAEEVEPDDLASLDKIWEEEAVAFLGNAGENACGPDRLQRQMRAHTRSARSEDQPAHSV